MNKDSESATPRTIDEYLEALDPEKRAALERLRGQIHAAAPRAEECISYGVPGFRYDGRLLVSFGAAARHCAFYPGPAPIETHRDELGAYSVSKGTIRFHPEKPLPAALVRRIVRTGIGLLGARKPASGSANRSR